MMLRRQSATVEAPDQPLAVGAVVGGWRVARVLPERDERYTMIETAVRDGKRATLKLFRAPVDEPDELRQRIRALANVRAAIDAPLLPVLGAGERDGVPYVAHPLVQGSTLAELLRDGPLDPATTMTLVGQIAGGLETATILGLPHGMLTPESVLVTRARPRQALLIDYGFAMPRGAACARAGAIKAADYCAPEAARGEPAEPASSVYALACILVECLTGAPPYPYERPLVTLHAHLVESPPRVSERRSGLPPALDDVIATALNKRPEQRHASPARFMRAAQKALAIKAPIPVAVAARRHVDAAAASARRPAAVSKPQRTPSRPAGRDRKPGPVVRRTPARSRPRRRFALWPAPAALGLVMALLASTAGFAAGHLVGNDPVAPQPAREAAAVADHTAYVRGVERVMRRLDAQRATARRKLRGARRPSDQASHATALADAYRDARKGLPARRASTSAEDPLGAELGRAERAYRALAAAAKRRNARSFRAAGHRVLRRERELQRALGRVQRI
jgi:serine/threonine protein kinase, bacterial